MVGPVSGNAAFNLQGGQLPPALLAICHPSGCTLVSGVVIVVVVVVVVIGVCNRSQMRTSKCTCLIFGLSVDLNSGYKCVKGFLIVQRHMQRIAYHLWMASSYCIL